MKKVMAIAPYPFLPYYSGGQKFIAGFYEHLAKKTSLFVVSTPGNDPALAQGYRLLPLLKESFSRYLDLSLVNRLVREINALGIDTVIWEHPYYYWLARRIKQKTGVKTFLHTHNIEYQRFRSLGRWWWPLLRHYERRFFKMADKVLFITETDKSFAIEKWNISREKCLDLPFGIEQSGAPPDRHERSREVRALHGLGPEERLFLFNGLLDYGPNRNALRVIVEKIEPALRASGISFRVLVCGKALPPEFHYLADGEHSRLIYAGFVDNIGDYFKAADIFLNPVMSGGGIKTKMVEAIAYGTTVVSTQTGATGINAGVCGEKLVVVPDGDWNDFVKQLTSLPVPQAPTPPEFYAYYHWDSVIGQLIPHL